MKNQKKQNMDTVDKLMDVFIGQFLYVAVFPDNLNKP